MEIVKFSGKVRRKLLKYRKKISSSKNLLILKLNDVEMKGDTLVVGKIFIFNEGSIKLGMNVKINSAQYANPIGGNEHTYLQIYGGGYSKSVIIPE